MVSGLVLLSPPLIVKLKLTGLYPPLGGIACVRREVWS